LSNFALEFTSVEYFSLALFGLVCVAAVSGGSIIKGIIGASIGILLGAVGIDPVSGMTRFTFSMSDLLGGIPLIPALIAFFAVAEIMVQAAVSQRFNVLPTQEIHPVIKLPGIMLRRW